MFIVPDKNAEDESGAGKPKSGDPFSPEGDNLIQKTLSTLNPHGRDSTPVARQLTKELKKEEMTFAKTNSIAADVINEIAVQTNRSLDVSETVRKKREQKDFPFMVKTLDAYRTLNLLDRISEEDMKLDLSGGTIKIRALQEYIDSADSPITVQELLIFFRITCVGNGMTSIISGVRAFRMPLPICEERRGKIGRRRKPSSIPFRSRNGPFYASGSDNPAIPNIAAESVES